jgi:hypothetical protein
VADTLAAVRQQLARQVAHWTRAAAELEDLSRLASPTGWGALERDLGVALRSELHRTTDRLKRQGAVVEAEMAAAETLGDLRRLQKVLLVFRRRYLAAEAVLDFYGDAVNTRTNETIGTYLRACDVLAGRSMSAILEPLGKTPPPVLTYLGEGLGASILKAGLRLWDPRTLSAVAAVKIVRHNLNRPTALVHEVGHQVSASIGWHLELASLFSRALAHHSSHVASLWAAWASEVVADAFAFAHTGYGSVAALHDVLSGGPESVTQFRELDPHPVGYLRVLLGCECCSRFFGVGPWDDLARAWIHTYPVATLNAPQRGLIEASRRALPDLVNLTFQTALRAFGGRTLVQLIDPVRVGPPALAVLERQAGPALYVSSHWVQTECVRLLALSSYKAATVERPREAIKEQEGWLFTLGRLAAAA